MIYVDTSVWVAFFVNEIHTARVQAWMSAHEVMGLACADWVKTEYASALSIKSRRGELDRDRFTHAQLGFGEVSVGGLTWLDVEPPDFVSAASFCADPAAGLRASDALHLAVALRTHCEGLFSLDKLMNQNAGRLGMRVIEP